MLAATLLWGLVAFAVGDRYDRLLAGFAGSLLWIAEAGQSNHTVLTAVPRGVDVQPADPALPAVRLVTTERHLSAPLVLGLLVVGAGAGIGARRRLRRVLWGAVGLFAVHTAGLVADVEFRPLMEAGFRGPVYYVYRFFWWVLDVWAILLLPAAAVLYVYVADWRGTRRGGTSLGRSAARAAAVAGILVLFTGGLVALRPRIPAAPVAPFSRSAPLTDPAVLVDARAAFLEGRYDEAAEVYRETLRADPVDTAARYNLGVSLYRQGRFIEALEELQQVRAEAPGFPGLDLSLGAALHDLGRPDEALEAFRRADSSEITDVALLEQVGTVLLAAGELEPAEQIFARVLTLTPRDATSLFHRGSIEMARGRLEPAVAWFERARNVRPDSLEVLNNLGVLYQELGRLEDAIVAYREAVRLAPDALPANFNLGKALVDGGDPCGALPYFAHCLDLPDPGSVHDRCRRLVVQLESACGG